MSSITDAVRDTLPTSLQNMLLDAEGNPAGFERARSMPMTNPGMPDAAMMDANIDDLFGEAADGIAAESLGVGLPSAPIPASLAMRITEMQNKGCCT